MVKILKIAIQTLHGWVKRHERGKLKGANSKPVSPEQMELAVSDVAETSQGALNNAAKMLSRSLCPTAVCGQNLGPSIPVPYAKENETMHKYQLLRQRAEEFRVVLEEYAQKDPDVARFLQGWMPWYQKIQQREIPACLAMTIGSLFILQTPICLHWQSVMGLRMLQTDY